MKLPRLRRRAAPETAEPVSGPAEPASVGPAAAPAFQALAYSRAGLPDEEFSAQTEALRRILSYDGDTRSWYAWLPLDRPGQAAEVLTALFEAARVHGTTVQVRAQPAGEDVPSDRSHDGRRPRTVPSPGDAPCLAPGAPVAPSPVREDVVPGPRPGACPPPPAVDAAEQRVAPVARPAAELVVIVAVLQDQPPGVFAPAQFAFLWPGPGRLRQHGRGHERAGRRSVPGSTGASPASYPSSAASPARPSRPSCRMPSS
jgi:hypothetical protein